jgi:hypothetical protein
MAVLLPSADVVVGEGSNPTREFQLKDAYGGAVNITGYAFRLRVYIRTVNASDANVDTELVDASGTIVTAAQGKFKFVLTHAHTSLPAGDYDCEIVAWSSGTVTDPSTERFRGTFTVEGKLEAP